jgi:hypothetical protein
VSYSGGWRPHIESALYLDLRMMLRRSYVWPGCDRSGGLHWTNADGEQVSSIGYHARLSDDEGELTLTYAEGDKPIECHIWLVTVPCHYGGRRWYMRCPYTGRRALKLYKWPGIDWFCHREAIKPKPTYACQRVGGLERVNAQRWALRRKIGDTFSDLCGEPMKPKWMRWRTFQRYLDRDSELEAREGGYLFGLLGRFGVPGFDREK